jgi:Spx/MgsR family transcriptional regulator
MGLSYAFRAVASPANGIEEARVMIVYGLKTCDTCRKALKWLDAEGIAHRFHDVRTDGLDKSALQAWIGELGWEALLNTRSTTWRGLAEAEKSDIDAAKAAALILAHPALMKRPLFDLGSRRVVGFKETEKQVLKGA